MVQEIFTFQNYFKNPTSKKHNTQNMSVKSTKMANKDKIKSTLKRKIEDSGSEETMNKKVSKTQRNIR